MQGVHALNAYVRFYDGVGERSKIFGADPPKSDDGEPSVALSEFLTRAPDMWERAIGHARRNPSPERLWARFEARLILASRKTKDERGVRRSAEEEI